jgi:hypothetical protein
VRGHDLDARKVFEDAAHDQPAQRQTQIERPPDAGGEPVLLHPFLAEAEMRRMDHHRHIKVLDELPERARLVVVGIMTLVAGMDEDALEAELTDRPLRLLDEGRPAAGQDGRERVERALVLVLNFGGVIGPPLHRPKLFMVGLAAQIMRGIGHDADVDAVLVMRVEKVLQHHRAAAFAPFRAVRAVQGAEVVRRFFRRVDVRMPVDDHAGCPLSWSSKGSYAAKRGNSRSAFSRRMAVMSAGASSNLLSAAAMTVVEPNGASDP